MHKRRKRGYATTTLAFCASLSSEQLFMQLTSPCPPLTKPLALLFY